MAGLRALTLGRCLNSALSLSPIASDLFLRATSDAGSTARFSAPYRHHTSGHSQISAAIGSMSLARSSSHCWMWKEVQAHGGNVCMHAREASGLVYREQLYCLIKRHVCSALPLKSHVHDCSQLAGLLLLQNLPREAMEEAAIAAALLLEHVPQAVSILLRPGALNSLVDAALEEVASPSSDAVTGENWSWPDPLDLCSPQSLFCHTNSDWRSKSPH